VDEAMAVAVLAMTVVMRAAAPEASWSGARCSTSASHPLIANEIAEPRYAAVRS
jgi:hypothetical protein